MKNTKNKYNVTGHLQGWVIMDSEEGENPSGPPNTHLGKDIFAQIF